jgi:hypothetical protein
MARVAYQDGTIWLDKGTDFEIQYTAVLDNLIVAHISTPRLLDHFRLHET